MYYLSFDIANKSLAISFLCFNKNYKNDIFKLKIQDNTIESYMNEMKNLNDELAIAICKNIKTIFANKIILYITHNQKVKSLFTKVIYINNGKNIK
jgi:hypothetical protein